MPGSALDVKDGVHKDMQRLKHRITLSECLHAVPLATAASSSSADSRDALPQASTEGLFAPGPSQKSREPAGLPGKPTGVGTSS